METRTLEQNLQSIAESLEALAATQREVLELAKCVHAGKLAHAPAPVKEQEPAPVSETPVEKTETWTYDDLKAELIKRGVEIPKGTKMTTLLKLWEKHKDDAPADPVVEETPADPVVEETPADPVVEETPADPVVEETDDLPFEPATEEPPAEPVINYERAKELLKAQFSGGNREDIDALRSALSAFGFERLPMTGVDNYYGIVSSYYAKKGIPLNV